MILAAATTAATSSPAVSSVTVAAVALGAGLIGVGILLVVAGFVINAIEKTRPKPPGPAPAAGFWDFMVELAKRLELIFVPGFLMIGLGIFLVGIVVVGAGPFGDAAAGAQATPSPILSPSPS